jgi:hypothetical protein
MVRVRVGRDLQVVDQADHAAIAGGHAVALDSEEIAHRVVVEVEGRVVFGPESQSLEMPRRSLLEDFLAAF